MRSRSAGIDQAWASSSGIAATNSCGEFAGPRAEPVQVAEAALGDRVGDRAQFEIGQALHLGHLGGGEGEMGREGAESQHHLLRRQQPAEFGDGLVRIGRVALDQPDRPAEQPAGGIAFLGRQFEPAEAFVAEHRQPAGEGEQRRAAPFRDQRGGGRPGRADTLRTRRRRCGGEGGQNAE